jgi:hypothetical protein
MSDQLHERFRRELEREWLLSPLGKWMIEHEAAVAALIAGAEILDRDDLATSFATAGLLDVRGRLPDAATTEETWRRVRSRPRFW